MRAAAYHYLGSKKDPPQRTGPTSPWTPSPTRCSSSLAPTATLPSRSLPSTYLAKPILRPPRAALTLNLSSCVNTSS